MKHNLFSLPVKLGGSKKPREPEDSPNRSEKSKGQALVELTLSFTALIFILSGVLDFGRAWYTYVAMTDAAAEAALYLSMFPQCPRNVGTGCVDPNNAYDRATNTASIDLIDWAKAGFLIGADNTDPGPNQTLIVDNNSDGNLDQGDQFKTIITYPFELYTPIISQIAGSELIILRAEVQNSVIAAVE